MSTSRKSLTAIIAAAFMTIQVMVSCKPSIPSEYLSKGELEDILYEYHIADQLFNQQGGDSLTLISYRANILKRHNVTEEEFKSTMMYYTRHTKLLHDVYESLSDRLNKEIVAQGGSSTDISNYGPGAAGSDTASIWNRDKCFVLAPYALSNNYPFEVQADTSFHKGDRIILDLDVHFMYQDGMHDAMAMLAVTYSNDSVYYQTTRMTSSSHYRTQIDDSGHLGIKRVFGYVYLANDLNNWSSTALRFAVFSNVNLLKMHVKEEPAAVRPDSTSTPKPSGTGRPVISNEQMEQAIKNGPKELAPVQTAPQPTGNKPKVQFVKPLRTIKQVDISMGTDKPRVKPKDIKRRQ